MLLCDCERALVNAGGAAGASTATRDSPAS
jgi:hypothetical protein